MDKDIRQTLKDILAFVDADPKYVDYAQLQTWLKQLIKRNT